MYTQVFRIYLGGLTADLLGDGLWFVGLTWAVANMASPAQASLVLAAASVPRLILLLPAGALVDRVGAMRVAQTAQLARIALMASLVILIVSQHVSLPWLLGVSAAFGVADALRLPASGSLMPAILDPENLPAGQGVTATLYRLTTIAAGPLAGLILVWKGFGALVALNMALFASAFLAYWSLKRRGVGAARNDESETRGIIDGLRYVAGRRSTLVMLVIVSLVNLAVAGPLELGLALQVLKNSWGVGALGILFGTFSGGAILGSLALSRWHPVNTARAGYLCSCAAGVALLPVGLSSNLPVAAVSVTICGLGFGPAGGLLLGGIQRSVDADHMGRVMSLITLSSMGMTPIGMLLFGFLAQRFQTGVAIAICGAAVVLATGSAAALVRASPTPDLEQTCDRYDGVAPR